MLVSHATLAVLTLPPTLGDPPAASISPDRLMEGVRALPAKRAAAGDEQSQKNLLALQGTLARRAVEMGYWPTASPIKWKRRTDPEALDWRNISFEIRGRSRPEEVLLVSAHFDAVPAAPGADDDGSGTSALLDMARALHGRAMHRTVRFVLFNLEELGHTGSNQYVTAIREDHRAGSPRIVGMMSLEMLGYYSDQPGSQRSPFKGLEGVPSPDKGDFIALTTISSASKFVRALDAAARTGEPSLKTVVIDMFPIAPPDLLRSDHTPFLLMGVPAVMVTDTADFRNANYHKPTDTPETLNPEGFARTVRGLTAAVHALAGPMELGDPPDWSPPPIRPRPADAPPAPAQPPAPSPKP